MFSRFLERPGTRKRRIESFMDPTNKLPYYEDYFGERNEDEFDEGPIDDCEPESGDEETSKHPRKPVRDRPFAPYVARRHQARHGELKVPGKRRLSAKLAASSARAQYDILATADRQQGTTTTSTPKRLTPRKFGIFGKMEFNEAGAAMDALLGDGDLDDGFQTVEPQSAGEWRTEGRQDSVTDKEGGEQTTQIPPDPYQSNPFARDDVEGTASDGDIATRSLQRNEPRVGEGVERSVMRSYKSKASGIPSKHNLRENAPNRAVPPPDSGAPRRSARQLKGKTEAASQLRQTRSLANKKVAEIAASNRSKMTARAFSLHRKAKEQAVGTRPVVSQQDVHGRKVKGTASKSAAKEEYYCAVYGRRRRRSKTDDVELEYADVIPSAVARAMEQVGDGAEVVGKEVDSDEYEGV